MVTSVINQRDKITQRTVDSTQYSQPYYFRNNVEEGHRAEYYLPIASSDPPFALDYKYLYF